MLKQISLEELLSLPTNLGARLSKDKSKLAYLSNKSGRLEMHLIDLASQTETQVTNGQLPASLTALYVWYPDNEQIIIPKDSGGNEQHDIHLFDLNTQTLTQLTNNPECVEYPVEVHPNGRWLLVNTTKFGQMNIAKLDLTQPEAGYQPLTQFNNPTGATKWSPDGLQVLFATNETDNLLNQDVYIMQADGSNVQRILHLQEDSYERAHDWQQNLILFSSDASGQEQSGLYDVQTGEIRWLGDGKQAETGVALSENGRYASVSRVHDGQISVVVYNTETGEGQPLNLPPGVTYYGQFFDNDQKLLIYYTNPAARPSFLAYDLNSHTAQDLVPAEYGSIDPALFGGAEHVWYKSADGTDIPAIYYPPKAVKAGEKCPAVVDVHGGPTWHMSLMFNPFTQLLLDQGYAVLHPNFRGSTGYGSAFRDANIKDWGGGDLEDVAAGVDFLATFDSIDTERVAIMGPSYGGYMTYMQVTKKPDLWKVGIADVGITDLPLLYEESMAHFQYYLRQLMGDPAENKELWQDRSAINFVHQLKAKLFMLHGLNDPRCPISQARNFRDKLLALGKQEGEDFAYVEFGDVGHAGSTDTQFTIKKSKLMLDYLLVNL